MIPALAEYVALTFALVVTPGAATTVVVRNAIEGGWRRGLATAAGAATGNATHAALAGLGVAYVLRDWPAALVVLRWSGVVFLAYQGAGTIRRSLAGRPSPTADDGPASAAPSAWRQGAVVNLLNPPIVVFYLVVVPTFVPADVPGAFALLALVHITMAFVVHGLWALAFDRVRAILRRPASVRLLDAGAGIALIYLAARTALSR